MIKSVLANGLWDFPVLLEDQHYISKMKERYALGGYSYQLEHISHLVSCLRDNGIALDISKTGQGKTYTAIETGFCLGIPTKDILVLATKSAVKMWEDLYKARWVGCPVIKTHQAFRTMEFPENIRLIIVDEAHKIRNCSAQVSNKFIKIRKEKSVAILLMSATLVEHPVNMNMVGQWFGDFPYRSYLHQTYHWRSTALRSSPDKKFYHQPDILQIKELLKPFCFQMKSPTQEFTNRLFVRELNNEALQQTINDGEESIRTTTTRYLTREHAIKELELKVEVARLKLIYTPYVKKALEQHSLVYFCTRRATLSLLGKMLSKDGISFSMIHGDQSKKERAQQVQNFQDNKTKVCISTLGAGSESISLHDIHGGHPRIAFICVSYNAVNYIQALGRINRRGKKSNSLQYIYICKGTHEEKINKTLRLKINNYRAMTVGEKKW